MAPGTASAATLTSARGTGNGWRFTWGGAPRPVRRRKASWDGADALPARQSLWQTSSFNSYPRPFPH
jgi:hypothetical protein